MQIRKPAARVRPPFALASAPEEVLLHVPLACSLRRRRHESLIVTPEAFVNSNELDFADLMTNNLNDNQH